MEQFQYLIDTNSVIDYLGGKLPISGTAFMDLVIDAHPNISVITKIEVLGFKATAEVDMLLTSFMNDARVLDLSNSVVEASIQIRKKSKIKLPDAIIAATALVNGFTLISRNVSDFRNIEGLKVIDPHNL